MAKLEGDTKKCKEQIEQVLKKINEGKYKIDYTVVKVGTEETEPIKDETGSMVRNYKRNFQDILTVSYIDIEAKKLANK